MHDVLDAVETFFTHLGSVDLRPTAPGGRLPPAQARLHQPRLAERDRRRVPGRARPLAARARRVRRRSRRQRCRPCARRRRAPPLPRSPRGRRKHVHDACVDLRRHGASPTRRWRSSSSPTRSRSACSPGLSLLPDLRSFDFVWLLTHPRATGGILFALAVAGLALAIWLRPRIDDFRGSRRTGVRRAAHAARAISATVVAWQLADWGLRLATIWFFLAAFGVEQSVKNVVLVQVTHSLATLVPISPGGIGTEQAFLVYVFQGKVLGRSAARLQRRRPHDAHGRQRRGGGRRSPADATHAPLQAVRRGGADGTGAGPIRPANRDAQTPELTAQSRIRSRESETRNP